MYVLAEAEVMVRDIPEYDGQYDDGEICQYFTGRNRFSKCAVRSSRFRRVYDSEIDSQIFSDIFLA
jgi:hypothetical protein